MTCRLALLGAFALALTGCFTPPPLGSRELARPDPVKAAPMPRPPAVNPEQVNDSNAHAQAAALEAELEFDSKPDMSNGFKMEAK